MRMVVATRTLRGGRLQRARRRVPDTGGDDAARRPPPDGAGPARRARSMRTRPSGGSAKTARWRSPTPSSTSASSPARATSTSPRCSFCAASIHSRRVDDVDDETLRATPGDRTDAPDRERHASDGRHHDLPRLHARRRPRRIGASIRLRARAEAVPEVRRRRSASARKARTRGSPTGVRHVRRVGARAASDAHPRGRSPSRTTLVLSGGIAIK